MDMTVEGDIYRRYPDDGVNYLDNGLYIYIKQLCENLTQAEKSIQDTPDGVKIRGKREKTPATLASRKVRR